MSTGDPRTVSIPGAAWTLIEGSEVLGGGGGHQTDAAGLAERQRRSGYCMGLVWGLAQARVVKRGRGRTYECYLTAEARADLVELLDAISYGVRDDGTSSERHAIRVTLERLA